MMRCTSIGSSDGNERRLGSFSLAEAGLESSLSDRRLAIGVAVGSIAAEIR
jgi:hypothetical protein